MIAICTQRDQTNSVAVAGPVLDVNFKDGNCKWGEFHTVKKRKGHRHAKTQNIIDILGRGDRNEGGDSNLEVEPGHLTRRTTWANMQNRNHRKTCRAQRQTVSTIPLYPLHVAPSAKSVPLALRLRARPLRLERVTVATSLRMHSLPLLCRQQPTARSDEVPGRCRHPQHRD